MNGNRLWKAAIFSVLVLGCTAASAQEVRQLNRLYNQRAFDHKTSADFDPLYPYEKTLGWVSTVPFDGSRPIFLCHQNKHTDYFTSLDANCEGHQRGDWRGWAPHLTGYISATPMPGTAALYRCLASRNHFESLDPKCEGYTTEQLLGYVFW